MSTGNCCHCGKNSDELRDDYCPDCFDEYHRWCSVCKKHIHENEMCGHLWWGHNLEWWTGPGSDDKGVSCKESFLAMVKATGMHDDLVAALENGTLKLEIADGMIEARYYLIINGTDYSSGIYRIERDAYEYKDGVLWLNMLVNACTPEALEMTLEWLGEEERS